MAQTTSVSDAAGPKVIVPSKATTQAYVLNGDGSLTGFSTSHSESYALSCGTPSGLAGSGAQSLTLAINDRRGTAFQTGQGSSGPAVVGRAAPNSGSGCIDSPALALGGNAANALLSAHDANQDYLFVVSAGAAGKPDTLNAYYTAGVFSSGGTLQPTGQQNLDTGGTYTSLVVDENSSNSDAVVTEMRTATNAGGTWFYNKTYDKMIRILGPGGVDLPAVNSFIIHNPTDGGGELLVLVNQDGLTATNILDPPVDATPFTIIDLGWLHDLAVAKNNPATLTLPSVTNINSSLGYFAMLGAVYNRGDKKIYAVVVGGSDISNILRLVVRYDPSNPSSPAETVVNDVSSAPLNGSQLTQLAINGASGTLQMLAKDSNRLFSVGITGGGGAVNEITGSTFSDTNFTPVYIASNTLLGETYIASTGQVDVLTKPAANKAQVYLDLLGYELKPAVGAGNVVLLGVFPDPSDADLLSTNITITATPQGGSPYTFATVSAYSTLRIPALVNGSFPSKGIYTLVATFPGDSVHAAATSVPVTIAVGQPIFTTTVAATGTFNTSTGSGVAKVTLSGTTYVPTGRVTITSVNTGETLATSTLSGGLSNPLSITFTAPTTTTGIVATYSGDTKHATSKTGNVTLTFVRQVTPTIALTGPATAKANNPVAFNVKFVSSSTATPTGIVSIFASSATQAAFLVGAVNASAAATADGASLSWTPANSDTYTLTASYGGDGSFNAVNNVTVGSIVVSPLIATTITVTASSNPQEYGSLIMFEAFVVKSSGTASTTGTVTFLDGGTQIGVATILATGTASLYYSTPPLSIGTHNITAQYSGDTTYAGSSSPILVETITISATSTILSTSAAAVATGAPVTFTANVATNDGLLKLTGTVTFLDGATPLGTVTLDANGVATFTTSTLSNGTHSITASFGGDANSHGSVSRVLQEFVGSTAPTTTVLDTSATTLTSGHSVDLSAAVTSIGGVPTGNVQFLEGATVLATVAVNASGIATYTVSSPAVGMHTYTAVYVGTSSFATSTSPAVAVQVTGTPDFSVTVNHSTLAVSVSASLPEADFTLTVTPLNGYAGTVTATCGPLPSFARCEFAHNMVTFTAASTTPQTLDGVFNPFTRRFNLAATPAPNNQKISYAFCVGLGLIFFGWSGYKRHRKIKNAIGALLALMLMAGTLGLSGCDKPNELDSDFTALGTYTVPVTVTDGKITHTLNVTIMVNP